MITLAVLVGTAVNGFWLSRIGEIAVTTDISERGGKYTLQYNGSDGKKHTAKAAPDKSGLITFSVTGKTLSYFKIDLPDTANIKKVSFYNLWKIRNLSLTNGREYTGKILKIRRSPDLYRFAVIAFLTYYFACFIIRSLVSGLPHEDFRPPRMMNMEFLRIIFTFVIVFFHLRLHKRINIFFMGRSGVEFFFILSGFFFALTYERTPTVIDFIKRKIIRFIPCIVFCSLFGVFLETKTVFPLCLPVGFSG